MSELVEVHDHPELSAPVLVVALEGWIDAGGAAVGAGDTLRNTSDAQTVATFDADRIVDQRARRPVMHLVNGLITGLEWATTELSAGTDTEGNDLLILSGVEPDFEWAAFTRQTLELAEDFEAKLLVYLGAYPAPVPHTRPVNLAVTTSSTQLSEQLKGYVRGSLDVPAGIHTVLDVEANQIGLPAVGLWAQVPHYLAAMPYPAASLALLEGLHDLAGLSVDTGRLPSEARASRSRIDDLVNDNPDHQRMVAQLEEVVDSDPEITNDITPQVEFGELPSGDELAAELQKFLRDRPGDE